MGIPLMSITSKSHTSSVQRHEALLPDFSIWMGRPNWDGLSACELHDDKHVEDTKADGMLDEEVTGQNRSRLVSQKGVPHL